MTSKKQTDGGRRRSGVDRRRFSYDAHIPEHRSGLDKRNVADRRVTTDRRISPERRILRKSWNYRGLERRIKARRTGSDRRTSTEQKTI